MHKSLAMKLGDSNYGKDYGESVYLNFRKQYDGTHLSLSYRFQVIPQDKVGD